MRFQVPGRVPDSHDGVFPRVCVPKVVSITSTRPLGFWALNVPLGPYKSPSSQGDNVRESQGPRWHLKIVFDDTSSMMAPLRDACETVDCRLPDGFPDHPLPYDLREKVCDQYAVSTLKSVYLTVVLIWFFDTYRAMASAGSNGRISVRCSTMLILPST